MLEVPEFRQLYPRGGKVFDARGREIHHVSACNPETGEVVTRDMSWIARAWIRLLWTRTDYRHPLRPLYQPGWTYFITRHGFWPAPLSITPQQPEVQS
jgi:hypothetical protein